MQSSILSPHAPHDLWIPASDLPSSNGSLFWRPRFLCESTYLPHLPFTFWLAEVTRPQRSVVLGLGDGVAHFALCQAGERLGAADCWGIETTGPVPVTLQDYASAEYPEFSRLVESAAATDADLFRERPIDLLVISGQNDPVTAAAGPDRWLERLSERGLVLVPNLDAQESTEAGRAVLARLGAAGPIIRLENGGGLLLAMIGTSQPEPLRRLADLAFGAPGYAQVRRVFARLGQGCVHEWGSRQAVERQKALEHQTTKANVDRDTATRTAAEVQARLDILQKAYDERSRVVAMLQAQLFDHFEKNRGSDTVEIERLRLIEETAEQLRAELAVATAERDQARAAAAETAEQLRAELAVATAERDQARAAAAETAEQLRAELAVATAERDQARAAAAETAEQLRAELAVAATERDQARAAAAETAEQLRAELAVAAAERDQARAAAAETAELIDGEIERLVRYSERTFTQGVEMPTNR